MDERPAEADLAGEPAHVDAAGRKRPEDPEAVGVGECGEDPPELVAGQMSATLVKAVDHVSDNSDIYQLVLQFRGRI